MKLKKHFFLYIMLLLVLLSAAFSYFRFIKKQDYLVGYEGVCDPTLNNCFVGCEDDECTQEYFYSKVQKYALDVYNECGSDITDCEFSSYCLPEDKDCSVVYCDPKIDGEEACSSIENEDNFEEPLQTINENN